MLRIKLDRQADALYVYLKDGQVARSVASDNGIVIDEDASGNVVGVEILHVSKGKGGTDLSSIALEITDSSVKE